MGGGFAGFGGGAIAKLGGRGNIGGGGVAVNPSSCTVFQHQMMYFILSAVSVLVEQMYTLSRAL